MGDSTFVSMLGKKFQFHLHTANALFSPGPPYMQVTIEDVQVNSGERAKFQAVIEGTPQPTVLWFKVSADSPLAESQDCSAQFHGEFRLPFPPTPLTQTLDHVSSLWNQLFPLNLCIPPCVVTLQRGQPRWFWGSKRAGRESVSTRVSLRCVLQSGGRNGIEWFIPIVSVTSRLYIFPVNT